MEPFFSVAKAMEVTGLPRSTIYVLLSRGTLTARKAGRRTLIDPASVRAYLDALPPAQFRARASKAA